MGACAINSLKNVFANFQILKAWQQTRPKSLATVSTYELNEAYERLEKAVDGDEVLCKDLDKLKVTAESGLKISHWSRRFVFGFGVAKAIEEWFQAFDNANPELPLIARIPRNETSTVAAKWLWFGFFTTLIGVMFSLLVAGVTAYFLFKQAEFLSVQTSALLSQGELANVQIELLAQQVENTREATTNAQRTQYTQILYDQACELEGPTFKEICKPAYNFRIRTEAAKAFMNLERAEGVMRPDLERAQLEGIDLSDMDLNGVNFLGANIKGARLYGAKFDDANLNGANLSRRTVLTNADLRSARITGTDLRTAYLVGANLSGVDLSGYIVNEAIGEGELRTDLGDAYLIDAILVGTIFTGVNIEGANLSRANLTNARIDQDQLDSACGDENPILPEGLTIAPCSTQSK